MRPCAVKDGKGALAGDLLLDVDRLHRVVEDLLLLARTDADAALPLRRQRVDVTGLVCEVVRRYAGARVPVTCHAPADLTWATEPDALSRILINLLDNAVRHADSVVRVDVAADPTGDGDVVLAVTDDGPGIPAADRAQVFERFARMDNDRGRASGGSGLGLPIVAALAERLGGRIELTDAPNRAGLRAELRIPADRSGTQLT